jgi:hypothetical protein
MGPESDTNNMQISLFRLQIRLKDIKNH